MIGTRDDKRAKRDYYTMGDRILHFYDNADAYHHLVAYDHSAPAAAPINPRSKFQLKYQRAKSWLLAHSALARGVQQVGRTIGEALAAYKHSFSRSKIGKSLKVRGENDSQRDFTVAVNHAREQLRAGMLPALIVCAAFDICMIVGTSGGILVAGPHLNSMMIATMVINLAGGMGIQRYREMNRTLHDITNDYKRSGEPFVRLTVNRLRKELTHEPPSRAARLIRRLTGQREDAPTYQPALESDPERQYAKSAAQSIEASPQATEPALSPAQLSRPTQQFLVLAQRLHDQTQSYEQRGLMPTIALDEAHRYLQQKIARQPRVRLRNLFARLSPMIETDKQSDMLKLAHTLYHDSLTQPGHPGFLPMLVHFAKRQRESEPA